MSEKRKNKRSKEEIAKEFDLPERKSKIATIMKHDGEAYCLCRSSDCSRFMIGCDGCEEWYHGDCINVSEKEAKHIKHYYCQRCKEEDPTLQTVFRAIPAATVPGISNEERKLKKLKDKNRDKEAKAGGGGGGGNASGGIGKSSKDRCGQCSGCLAQACGQCSGCLSRKSGSGKKHRCEKRICLLSTKLPKKEKITNSGNIASLPGMGGGTFITSSGISISASVAAAGTTSSAATTKPKLSRSNKRRRRSPSPEIFINPELEGIRQCYGPGCPMTARPQSKYCSDDCGKKLATNRIYQVLPQRIQEWNLSPCKAEDLNKKTLDTIRAKQVTVRAILAELDKRHKELDLLVDRAKHCSLDPKALDLNDVEDEMSMYCITCGHEIHSKTAIRHMEKCFNKYESQASFGSIFKTRMEGNSMFCDFYNSASKTYCKRLRVLCPEHCKDAKVLDTDVCGCPLVRNTFELTGEFCRAPKKNCFRHYVWEKIRRAEIDLERVRQWLKMDELVEQERHVRTAMASRAGVLGLMLHSTYNHVIMEKLLAN